MKKTSVYLHHKHNDKVVQKSDPIARDREFNKLIDQWMGGQISYEEMKIKHTTSDEVDLKQVLAHLFDG